MTGSASAAQGRRLLVATAVAHYPKAPQWDRPGLANARQQVIDLFTGVLGYAHVSDLGLDPTETQLTEHLRTLCRHRVRPEDHLVVYIAGHGEVLDDGGGRHVLLTADTDPDDVADALPTLRLADKMLLGTPVQRLLLLLDTCYSGSGGNQVAAAVLAGMDREWTTSGSGLVVVTSTQPFEQAETGAFPTLLSAVVQALSTAGQVPPSLDLGGVVQAMNSHPERPAHQQIGLTALGLTGPLPDFLPNPRHRPGMTDIDLHLQQAAEWDAHAQRREVEFRRRFLVRAMAAQGPAQAWWFSGRRVALTDITTWLTQPSPQQAQPFPQDVPSPAATPAAQRLGARALVVTAGPGSGKTAVLGLVSALTHPEHRPTVPLDAIQLPPAATPPIGAVDVTIYAGGLTHDQVQAGLAAAAQIRADTIGELITALDARATASGRPFTAIVDALDEAADPTQLITQVLRPITDHAHGVRLLLGTRPHLLKLLQPPGIPARVGVIDLDAPRWADRQALTVYTIRNLIEASPDSPYRNAGPRQARSVADAVADAADPSFLVARITSTTLAAADTIADPTDPRWRASLPRLPGDAMRKDLDTRLGPDAARARDLLRPLAYAEGQGLPWEDIWAPLASRISGHTYTNDDLHWLRQHAGSYVVEATEASRSAYRLYHQALTEHLRATTAAAGLSDTAIHQAYADVLTTRVPRTLEATRDWAHAHPYTLHHLATHAAAAGTLEPLLDDAEYLVHADPDTLLPALDHVHTNQSRLTRTVYRASAGYYRHATPAVRRQLLAIDAARAGADTLRQALATDLPWQPQWATGTLINPALRTTLAGHTQPVNAVACTHLEGGTPIAITGAGSGLGGGGGEVIVWDLRTGQQRATLAGHTRPVNAVACTHLEGGTPIAITGAGSGLGGGGEVIVWDLRTGQQHATLAGHTRPVNAVACTHLEGGTPIAITGAGSGLGGGGGEVIVWDLRTSQQHATLAGHTQPVRAVACTHLEGGTPIAITGAGSGLGGGGGEVIVWDLRTSQQHATLAGHTQPVNAVACTHLEGGTPIAITGAGSGLGGGGEVIVWDLRTGQQHATLAGHTQPVNAVACTHLEDGTPIAITGAGVVGGGGGEVIVWDLRTGQQHATLAGHTQPVRAVACTHLEDGTPIAITGAGSGLGGGGGEVIVWDLRTGQQHATLAGHTQPVNAVACTHLEGGTPIAITGAGSDFRDVGGEVIVWDLRTGQQHATLAGHTQPVNAVACTHLEDGTPIAITGAGSADGRGGEVIVWDLRTGQQRATLAGHTQPVRAVACTHLEGGTPIAITGAGSGLGGGGEVIVWDLRTGQQHATLAGHTRPVNAVACTHLEGGTPIAITGAGSGLGGGGGEVIVWDLRTGQQHATLAGHTQPVRAVACTHLEDGTPIAITGAGSGLGGGGGEVIVWDLRTGRMQQTLAAPYPVGALCCDSGRGVAIGTATEIVALQARTLEDSSGPAQAPGRPQK